MEDTLIIPNQKWISAFDCLLSAWTVHIWNPNINYCDPLTESSPVVSPRQAGKSLRAREICPPIPSQQMVVAAQSRDRQEGR